MVTAVNALTNEEYALIQQYRPWLNRLAHEIVPPSEVDDLIQEGIIAMWKAVDTWHKLAETHPNLKLRTHCMKHAKWRMLEVAKKKNYTGRPSRMGVKHVDEDLYDFSYTSEGAIQFPAEEDPYTQNIQCHMTEIHTAIRTLTPTQRNNVFSHFWRGENRMTAPQWWYRSKTGARDKLRTRLEHLRELVA